MIGASLFQKGEREEWKIRDFKAKEIGVWQKRRWHNRIPRSLVPTTTNHPRFRTSQRAANKKRFLLQFRGEITLSFPLFSHNGFFSPRHVFSPWFCGLYNFFLQISSFFSPLFLPLPLINRIPTTDDTHTSYILFALFCSIPLRQWWETVWWIFIFLPRMIEGKSNCAHLDLSFKSDWERESIKLFFLRKFVTVESSKRLFLLLPLDN